MSAYATTTLTLTVRQICQLCPDTAPKILLDVDHEDHLSWKTASNVWVLVSRMCKDMVDAKRRDLRVRDD